MINKLFKNKSCDSENENAMQQEIGWQDFLNCYNELELLRKSNKLNTKKAITNIKYCHEYISSLSEYEQQMICRDSFFATKFNEVNTLYNTIEETIKETVKKLAKNIKDSTTE